MSPEEATKLACKHAKRKPQSYFAEPFVPHEWVLDAIHDAWGKGVESGIMNGANNRSGKGKTQVARLEREKRELSALAENLYAKCAADFRVIRDFCDAHARDEALSADTLRMAFADLAKRAAMPYATDEGELQ